MVQAALKISHNGEIHRSRVDLDSFQLSQLQQLVSQTFGLPANSFILQYVDPEGDCLNVCSDAEYVEACRVFLSANDPVKSLKFSAVTRSHAAFQERIEDPVVSSLETLVQALTTAANAVKRQRWPQTVATEVRGSLNVARQTVADAPYEQVLRDTTDSLRLAAEGFSSFAQGIVSDISQQTPAPAAAVPEVPVVAPVVVEAPVQEEPAPVVAVVAEEVPVAQEVAAPVVAVEEVVPAAFSDAEVKWAEQLSIVGAMLPSVSTERVIDLLERTNGNIEQVVDVLMEEI